MKRQDPRWSSQADLGEHCLDAFKMIRLSLSFHKKSPCVG